MGLLSTRVVKTLAQGTIAYGARLGVPPRSNEFMGVGRYRPILASLRSCGAGPDPGSDTPVAASTLSVEGFLGALFGAVSASGGQAFVLCASGGATSALE